MIHGFDDITHELTAEEIELLPVFVKGLSSKIGEDMAITSGEISKAMEGRGVALTGARIRKIINYLRVKKLVRNLVASSKGYYVELDPKKILEYRKGLLARARAIEEVANTFEPYAPTAQLELMPAKDSQPINPPPP